MNLSDLKEKLEIFSDPDMVLELGSENAADAVQCAVERIEQLEREADLPRYNWGQAVMIERLEQELVEAREMLIERGIEVYSLRQELREYRRQQKVREEFEAGCG